VRAKTLEIKPAYTAYATLGKLFTEGSRIDLKTEWDRGSFCAVNWRQPDKTRVWALWTPENHQNVKIKIGKGFRRAINYIGEDIPVTDKTTELSLSPEIIYLVGAETLDFK
jgi:hypothetical protein